MSIARRISPLAFLALGSLVAPRSHTAWATGSVADPAPVGFQAPSAERADTSIAVFPAGWPFRTDQVPTAGSRGMVVSTDSLASAAGLAVLREGGNAIDAAVAVHFALAVVYPQAGNLGGGGFMVVRTADGREATLDFREKAPLAAGRDMYVGEDGKVGSTSRTGHLAAGVPGSVAGMAKAHRRFGRLPWERLLEPARRLAADGFHVSRRLHNALTAQVERLRRFPATAAIFLPDGHPPGQGTVLRQPDLARSLGAISASGADVFYRGWIGDSLVAEMVRGGGLISKRDLEEYRAIWRRPIVIEYADRRLISMGPPSGGGVVLGEMLGMLERFDLRGLEYRSADEIHLLVEAMRRAYADRNRYLGDSDFVGVPIDRLLSAAYLDSLARTIDPARATPAGPGAAAGPESAQTTHYSVVDSAGNAVAVTTTINGLFGSAVVVRGAGFLLNNEMDDFTTRPGEPNMYGLVQGESNSIAPGKRMLSAMTPTIVIAPDGRLELVTGTPGGPTITTSVLQVVLAQLDHGLNPQQAVNAPRVHHQHIPDLLRYERGGLEPSVIGELERRGHRLEERAGFSGDVQSIWVAPDGVRYGAADPRGGGAALGY
ncbi:MAG: gamma-glutamyltransferase [Gemmatimonadales bacterium]|jgi:gamma-glutamyltranspeptidase/glutathione hydrolase